MVDRLRSLVTNLPVAHRVMVAASLAGLALALVLFARWVATPSYTVLYSGLDAMRVSNVVTELETLGVPYQLEGGGSTILVPRSAVFDTRARLAGAGIAVSVAPEGYERLAEQGLTVSDFRQQVDYRIAVEGELARTLMAMHAIDMATVHLAIPEDELFSEATNDVTASVLVDSNRTIGPEEVETITFLVASAVEDLAPKDVVVADVDGTVLSAPGGASGAGITDRNLRMTRQYEMTVAAEVTRLLDTAVGVGRASVVVNADLDFDQRETESETFAPDSQVAVREQTLAEAYAGDGTAVGGVVGVDGGPLADGTTGATEYSRDENTVEYGVDRTVTRQMSAPGDVEKLSVAIVMDDGTVSGLTVPTLAAIQDLVTAAVGLDVARGDVINVTGIPFPEVVPVEEVAGPNAMAGILRLVPQVLGLLLLLAIGVALFLASRRREDPEDPFEQLLPMLMGAGGETPRVLEGQAPAAIGTVDDGASVTELVERQPEEIAGLLRAWLADAPS